MCFKIGAKSFLLLGRDLTFDTCYIFFFSILLFIFFFVQQFPSFDQKCL